MRYPSNNLFRSLLARFFVLLCCVAPINLQAETPIEYSDEPILPFTLSYLEDPSGTLTLQDILTIKDEFSISDTDSPNFGFSESVYWFYTRVANPSENQEDWLMEIGYPMLDNLQLHTIASDGTQRLSESGDKLPFNTREYATRNFTFDVEILAGGYTDLYLRVDSDSSMQVPIQFWPLDTFAENKLSENLLLGGYYGILLAMLVYNMMLIPWIRDWVYVYYISYLTAFCLFQLSITGLAYKYLWPESTFLAEHAILLSMSFAGFFTTLFTHALLEVRKKLPRHHLALMAVASIYLLYAPLSFLFEYQIVVRAFNALIIGSTIYFIYVTLAALRSGVSTARFYLFSWVAFLVGVVIYALKTQGLIPTNLFTEHAIQLGSALEVVLLSFAMAHRFKTIEEKLISVQIHAKETLEQRVAERTQELKKVLDELTVSNARLEGLNNTDQLTGINNRAFFDSHIEYVWNNTARANEQLAILMVDVDHFKGINDSYGHLIGDEVLIAIAQTISKTLTRSTDQVARYGGEEFVVVLPSTHEAGAQVVAERIRKSVASIRTLDFGLGSDVTVSVGVSCISPATSKLELRDVLTQADKALYKAKDNGRNRVEVYKDLPDGDSVIDFSAAARIVQS